MPKNNTLTADLANKTFFYDTTNYSNFTISVKNAWQSRTGFILFVVPNVRTPVALMIGYEFRGTTPEDMWRRSFLTDNTLDVSATMDSCSIAVTAFSRIFIVPMNSQSMPYFDFSLS